MGFSIRRSLVALSLGVIGVTAQFATVTTAIQTAASSTTSSSAAATWTIQVGKLDHVFSPDVVTANIGDTIEFDFYPTNHSVVRAAYEHPCVPYELAYPGKMGFFSGFHPVDTVLNNPPKWTVVVNDTEPIFYYCSAPGSCINREMVGVINPNANTSLAHQKELAGSSQFMLQPGQRTPDEAASSSSSSSTSQSATSTATPSTSATAAAAASTSHSSFPPGAIAGVVIGAVLIIALAAALFYFMGRHRSIKAQEAAASLVPSEKNTHGANSPVSISAMPGDPVVGPGGLVYVPAKAADFAPRMSMPPSYPQPQSYPHEAPVVPMSPHSPSQSPVNGQSAVNAHYSTVSAYDMGPHSPGLRSNSPPAEMYSPDPNHPSHMKYS